MPCQPERRQRHAWMTSPPEKRNAGFWFWRVGQFTGCETLSHRLSSSRDVARQFDTHCRPSQAPRAERSHRRRFPACRSVSLLCSTVRVFWALCLHVCAFAQSLKFCPRGALYSTHTRIANDASAVRRCRTASYSKACGLVVLLARFFTAMLSRGIIRQGERKLLLFVVVSRSASHPL
jgi:hypothetical protein